VRGSSDAIAGLLPDAGGLRRLSFGAGFEEYAYLSVLFGFIR